MSLTLFTLFVITEGVIMKSFLALEEQYVLLESERLINGVDSTILKLDAILLDWAHWDDTYEFINDEDKGFIESNIVPSTFEESEFQYMIILDKDYNVKLNRGYNIEEEKFTTMPDSFVEIIRQNINTSGLFWIDDRAVAISILDIQDSNKLLKPEGGLAFAFEFDESVIEEIKESYKIDIRIVHGVDINPNSEIIINRVEDKSIATFQVPYVNIHKAMDVEVIINNGISELGQKTVVNFMEFLTVILLIITAVLFIFLKEVVTSRISKLNDDVYKISHSEDLGKRVFIHGNDEISDLKDGINFMLEKIEAMNEKIKKHASVDNMTGTLNRRAGYLELEKIIKSSENAKHSICVAYIDINNLKIVNDNYGHQSGDALIKDIIEILRLNLRETDKISRLGGDEFLIIFPEVDYDTVVDIFERIDKSIMEFNSKKMRSYNLGISKGIAIYDYDMTTDEFIEIADKRMYTDKQKNRKK